MKDKYHIGQTVYLRSKPFRNLKAVAQGEIVKIGRKYITVSAEYQEIQFEIESGQQKQTEYGLDWTLYLSMQALDDELEHEELCARLRKVFINYDQKNLTLPQLREALKALGLD